MINKIKKYINVLLTQKLIKSIFFLKYLILIFSISLFSYLFIPKFLNYEKQIDYIENLLLKNYNINLVDHSRISYDIFPSPRINIYNTTVNFKKHNINSKVDKLQLVLKFSSIYNNNNLNLKKIVLKRSVLNFNIDNFKYFIKYIFDLNGDIYIQESKIVLKNYKNNIFVLDDVKFNNKNFFLKSTIAGNKFNIKFSKKNNNYNLVMSSPNLGLHTKINFTEDSTYENYSGLAKIKILDSNIKIQFKNNEKIEINKSYFRNNFLSTTVDGTIEFNPYFNFNLLLDLDYLNIKKIISQNIFKNIHKFASINSKLNGDIKLTYNEKKINSRYLNEANIFISFVNGDIKINKFYLLSDVGDFDLKGIITNINGFPKLNFYIIINLLDEKKLFKRFKLKSSNDNLIKKIHLDGNINLSSYKINFTNILSNKNKLKQEDLKFYENSLENLLIDNDLGDLFNYKKIKNFITEIY